MFSIKLSERADLRPLEPHQAPEFLALIEAERDHFGRWLPWGAEIDTEDKARAFIQRFADRQAADQGRTFAIWQRDHMVGGVLFRTFDSKTRNCEIGVWLAQHASGQGLVTKACNVLIDWAFFERNMARVEWHAASENTPSIRVAQRLGMHRDGVMREAFLSRGIRHDEEVWSLLATDARPISTDSSSVPLLNL